MNETPMAVISGARRKACRRGRYATRSMATLMAPVVSMVATNTSGSTLDELPAVERRGHAEQGEVAERDEEAQHEDVAVGEVDQADDPVDHGVAERDEGEDGAAGDPVDGLLDQDLMPLHRVI